MSNVRGIILTYASGVDLVVEWTTCFFTLPEIDDAFYFSPEFSFGGEIWKLCIFPNGSSRNDSSEHVDLCLFKCDSNLSIKQLFSISLKTANGEKYNEQKCTKNFDNEHWTHIFYRFIPRSELIIRRSELVPEGDLTVICTMKSSTSARSARDEVPTAEVNKSDAAGSSKSEASCSSQAGTTTAKEAEEEVPTAEVNKSDVVGSSKSEASGSSQADTTTTKESVPTAEVNKSDVAGSSKSEASCSSQASTTTTKESVLKWIKENCTIASKERKRKWGREKKNVLKWIEENLKETSEGKKRKIEEKSAVGKLLQDLKRIMVNGDHSDVTVSVRGEEFRLHRSILGVRNPFFGMRFNSESQETTPGTLSIEDCDPDQFRTLIHYIYTGMADNLCPENVCGLYDVAVAYQEQQMRAECLQLLMNTFSVENFCDYTTLAVKHDLEELLQKATELFVHKVKEITRHEKWEAFLEKYPAQANKLYMKALEQYDTK